MLSFIYSFRRLSIHIVKCVFHIENMTLFVRKKRQQLERLFYRRAYTADDIVATLADMGVRPGMAIVVHCAMNNFYNYRGSAIGLIEALLRYLGPEGTLCMPGYPSDRREPHRTFDVRNDKTAAGYLAETFRCYPGVKRSYNKHHAVCAIGKYADYLLSEHHLSKTSFDEHSPYYKLSLLGGKSVSFGVEHYYIGTIEHVCESLLRDKLPYFRDIFPKKVTYHYIDYNGDVHSQELYIGDDRNHYIRNKDSHWVERNFDPTKYSRKRLSNIWINVYDAHYTVERLSELALQGKTLFSYPPFYR